MKRFFSIWAFLVFCWQLHAQEEQPVSIMREMALENDSERMDAEANDDAYLQLMQEYLKHRLDLNRVNEEDLEALQLLTALQMSHFFSYRRLLGNFLSVYELQAIPYWDLETIKKLRLYVTVNNNQRLDATLKARLAGGDNDLLIRASQQMEIAKGFQTPKDSISSHYLGSRQKLFFRYRYDYKNLLQFGFLGDKDAGEPFLKDRQQYGFDFYSFHFFSKNMGVVKALALGDFTVNMGQGLIQWQTLAFTKTAEAIPVKRASSILRPYRSAGEFNFYRGAGISLQKGHWQATAFLSSKKMSANSVMDSVGRISFVTSFQNSGYHRTQAENDDRNNIAQTTMGGNISVVTPNFRIGINSVNHHFSSSIQKRELPYNLFAIRGDSWANHSIDYSYTYRNIHFFGEVAVDPNGHMAFLNGSLLSLSSALDLTLLHRKLDRAYQSLYSNAFTENTAASNESGFYMGISFRPWQGLRWQVYYDMFKFPWLRYLVNAPSTGREYLTQLIYQPQKSWAIYTRYKNTSKLHNLSGDFYTLQPLSFVTKQNWRTEFFMQVNNEIRVRNRVEVLWYDDHVNKKEEGFLSFFDFYYKPQKRKVAGNIRLQYFETGGYNSRIYAFENDVLYYSSIPSFYDKGWRYYVNIHFSPIKLPHVKIEAWLRWAQSIYPEKNSLGSGLDQIDGNKKSELRAQVLVSW
ncbi:MAG: hypothetical protein JST58_20665 [Bacteroidetes bacterium]|nr:hypothetical protein [Bacteroidota bacterium]